MAPALTAAGLLAAVPCVAASRQQRSKCAPRAAHAQHAAPLAAGVSSFLAGAPVGAAAPRAQAKLAGVVGRAQRAACAALAPQAAAAADGAGSMTILVAEKLGKAGAPSPDRGRSSFPAWGVAQPPWAHC
jgi:hypothetical protein